jgi:predicted nucleic acid-binding protein
VTTYYDTGILLKLYTAEKESAAVEKFIRKRKERIPVTDLHLAECHSALRLKVFRHECHEREASAAIELIKEDLRKEIMVFSEVDWDHTWHECRLISDRFAAVTGARTLDALHVAAARLLEADEFITSDTRQSDLARRVGLKVRCPF